MGFMDFMGLQLFLIFIFLIHDRERDEKHEMHAGPQMVRIFGFMGFMGFNAEASLNRCEFRCMGGAVYGAGGQFNSPGGSVGCMSPGLTGGIQRGSAGCHEDLVVQNRRFTP